MKKKYKYKIRNYRRNINKIRLLVDFVKQT